MPYVIAIVALLVAFSVLGWYSSQRLMAPPRQVQPQTPETFGMPFEETVVRSRDGLPLSTWIIPGRERSCIIVGHGHSGDKASDLPISRVLHAAGYTLALLDFRAHGRSGGRVSTLGPDEVQDVAGLLDALEQRGLGPFGYIGGSMGASIGIVSASLDQRIRALVADNSFDRLLNAIRGTARHAGCPRRLIQPISWMTLLASCARRPMWRPRWDPIRRIGLIAGYAPLIVHAEADRTIGVEQAYRLHDACPRAHFWVTPRADHSQSFDLYPVEYRSRLLTYLAETLPLKVVGMDDSAT